MKVTFNSEKKKWEEQDGEQSMYIDGYLKTKLDNVKHILSKNWDAVILIDGKERSGKSTLAFTCAWYLSDMKLTLENICKDTNDCIEKIGNLPDKSVVFVDEGSLSFSSKDAMKSEQRKLMKILDVVGQKNLCIIIVLPSFFELAKAIACRRSRFLLHVYTDQELNRGRFSYFGETKKRKLYDYGRKNFGSYDSPDADFIGRFVDFRTSFFEEYLKLKRETLMGALKSEMKKEPPLTARAVQLIGQRDRLITTILSKKWITQDEIAKILSTPEARITFQAVSEIKNKNKKLQNLQIPNSR